ncbi:MAG: septation protein A [Pseudomonadota bacterium]
MQQDLSDRENRGAGAAAGHPAAASADPKAPQGHSPGAARATAGAKTPAHHGPIRSVLEFGPLIVFFLCFQFGEEILAWAPVRSALGGWADSAALTGDSAPLYVATAVFMVITPATLLASWLLLRTLPRMAVVTAVIVAVFGGLTLWLQDETFIKMKPTIVNLVFASVIGAGLLQGRSYIKLVLDQALPLDDAGWMIFTRRWFFFFLFMAALNEAIWRTMSTEFWVTFKTFANLPITFVFMLLQVPLLQRHMIEDQDNGTEG